MSNRSISLKEVIAVGGIAAAFVAVLVPFSSAQGGSKGDAKSWYLTQLHQLGTDFLLYAGDYDDAFPLAMFRRSDTSGSWAGGVLTPSPADCVTTPPWNTPGRVGLSQTIWRNSVSVYAAFPSTTLPGAPEYTVTGEVFSGAPNLTNPTMNGLLQSSYINEIAAPSVVPMVWSGAGRTNIKGRTWSTPALNCGTSLFCKFNGHGAPSSDTTGDNSTIYILDFSIPTWIYGQTTPIIRVDSSVAIVPIGTAISPAFHDWPNVNVDPFAQVSSTGSPNSFWPCGPGHTVATPNMGTTVDQYPCYFRPDRTE